MSASLPLLRVGSSAPDRAKVRASSEDSSIPRKSRGCAYVNQIPSDANRNETKKIKKNKKRARYDFLEAGSSQGFDTYGHDGKWVRDDTGNNAAGLGSGVREQHE